MTISDKFYTPAQVRSGELGAAQSAGIDMYVLMERAGQAAFAVAMSQYPSAEHWLICCGKGNNGGDGYIIANLARALGIFVTVWQVGDPELLTGDAQQAYRHWKSVGGKVYSPQEEIPDNVDLIIDALLGTGLSGDVRPEFSSLIGKINGAHAPVIAVDIPSGLNGETGCVMGSAVVAQHTVSFIGVKQGMVTAQARAYCGEIHFAGLGVDDLFVQQNIPSANAIAAINSKTFVRRSRVAHKGTNGKALIVAGNRGMGGAAILSALAALRTGCGMVACHCDESVVNPLLAHAPEVMSGGWDCEPLASRVEWASVLAFGPGLGRDDKAKRVYHQLATVTKPKVVDADALHFLAQSPVIDPLRIITPHPGEAASLLGCSTADIESDRFKSVQALQKKYGGVVVLKGAGTLVADGNKVHVCLAGNPGMATAGMGDVLTGVIVALLAQGFSLSQVATLGVQLHSQAADLCAKEHGERGLIASDLHDYLRRLVN